MKTGDKLAIGGKPGATLSVFVNNTVTSRGPLGHTDKPLLLLTSGLLLQTVCRQVLHTVFYRCILLLCLCLESRYSQQQTTNAPLLKLLLFKY